MNYYILFLFILISSSITVGWIFNDLYSNWNQKRQIEGLWMRGFDSENLAEERAYEIEQSGAWVCVNIKPKLTFEEIVDTCIHEAGHELFARKCEDAPEICFELMKELENGR